MTLYVAASTRIPDVFIDFIELKLTSGKEITLTWDESGIDRRDDGFNARYKGVQIGEEYANGRLNEFKDFLSIYVSIYTETDMPCDMVIDEMLFVDGDDEYVVTSPNCTFEFTEG